MIHVRQLSLRGQHVGRTLVVSSHGFSFFFTLFQKYTKITNILSSMFPTSSCFTALLFSILSFPFLSFLSPRQPFHQDTFFVGQSDQGKSCTKSVCFKKCVLWLPRYIHYSMVAKRVESTRTGSDRSFTGRFTCVCSLMF